MKYFTREILYPTYRSRNRPKSAALAATRPAGMKGARPDMDIIAVIGELRKELERIDRLIVALDKLQHGRLGPGRPPKLLQKLRRRAASEKEKTAAASSEKQPPGKTAKK